MKRQSKARVRPSWGLLSNVNIGENWDGIILKIETINDSCSSHNIFISYYCKT